MADRSLSKLFQPGARSFILVPENQSVSDTLEVLFDKNYINRANVLYAHNPNSNALPNVKTVIYSPQAIQSLNLHLKTPNGILILELSKHLKPFTTRSGCIIFISKPFMAYADLYTSLNCVASLPLNTDILQYICLHGAEVQIGSNSSLVDITVNKSIIPISYKQYENYLETKSVQSLNVSYPDELVQSPGYKKLGRADILLENGGWITQEVLLNLGRYCPKLEFLIKLFRCNPGRYVIYTHFNKVAGMSFIETILTLAGFTVFSASTDSKSTERARLIDYLNSSKNGILLTNTFVNAEYENLNSVVIFEEVNARDTNLVNEYLCNLSSTQNCVHINLLVSVGAGEEETVECTSADEIVGNIDTMSKYINVLRDGFDHYEIEEYKVLFQNKMLLESDMRRMFTKTLKQVTL